MKSSQNFSGFALLGDDRGFTVAELLMAAFIGLIVLGASWGTVAMQGRSAAYQVGLADAQTAGRGAGALLLSDLRMAGFGMLGVSPDADFPPLEYSEAGGTTTLVLRGAFTGQRGSLAASAPAGSTSIVYKALDENPGTMLPSFVVGQHLLLDSGLDSEVKVISSIDLQNSTVYLDSALDHQYPMGPDVTQIEERTYTWDGRTLTRSDGVVSGVLADNATSFDLEFVDEAGSVSDSPADDLRSVVVDLVTSDPAPLPDAPVAESRVSTEVTLRNLMFRFM